MGKKFGKGIEVDRSKVEVIEKLPSAISVKGFHNFLCQAAFYRTFIRVLSKIENPL